MDQLLIRYSAFARYLRRKWVCNERVCQLSVDFKKACNSVRRDVLYNIIIEYDIPMKLVALNKCMQTKGIISRQNSSDAFSIRNSLKKGKVLSSLLLNFILECHQEKCQKIRKEWN